MHRRWLGNRHLHVAAIGLGCWGMSHAYGPADEDESMATMDEALNVGINFLDTADVYGSGHNESLIARMLKGRRNQVVVATKFGFVGDEHGTLQVCGRPSYVTAACEKSLKRLGTDAMIGNQGLLDQLKRLSQASACTPAQLALAWLLAKDPSIVPIPGMKRRLHLEENAAAVDLRLSSETMAALDGVGKQVVGERHNAQNLGFIDR